MSGSFSSVAVLNDAFSIPQEKDVSLYLENLASSLKNTDVPEIDGEDQTWSLINRVLAYAASAEQHIAEQQLRIRELENLSTTDELTGLHNRRALQEFLNRAISSARRYDEEGVVAFLDMDHFKAINDTHGHDAGDKVLKRLAQILRTNLRDTDFVARLGGDEFVFVLQRANHHQAIKRAREIRQMICEATITTKRSDISLSVSMGLAKYDGKSTYDAVMKAADNAMYDDKHSRKC